MNSDLQEVLNNPDTLGYIVAAEDGQILNSGGKLEREDRVARIGSEMLRLLDKSTHNSLNKNSQITIQFDHHFYFLTFSGKRVTILLRSSLPAGPVEA